MERRKQKDRRLRRRIEVRYGVLEPSMTGYSGNISSSGIMIRAIRVFGPGVILNLELVFPNQTFQVRGEITWAREGSVQLLPTGRIGMGIRFIDPPEELIQAIRSA